MLEKRKICELDCPMGLAWLAMFVPNGPANKGHQPYSAVWTPANEPADSITRERAGSYYPPILTLIGGEYDELEDLFARAELRNAPRDALLRRCPSVLVLRETDNFTEFLALKVRIEDVSKAFDRITYR